MGVCICICLTAIIISLILAYVYWMEHIKDLNDDVVMNILDELKELKKVISSIEDNFSSYEYDFDILKKVVTDFMEGVGHEKD